MATTIRARIYARGEVSFCQVSIFAKLVCQTVGGQFFLFCQNYMDAKLVCQTVGAALRSKLFFLTKSYWQYKLCDCNTNYQVQVHFTSSMMIFNGVSLVKGLNNIMP
jgi:hypothetical protein